jgi:hypothetical protein
MDTIPISIAVSIAGLLLTVATVYFAFVNRVTDKLSKISNRVTKVEADNCIFWKVINPSLAKIIHSPVHHTRDMLMDKLADQTITIPELSVLEHLLETDKALETDKGLIFAMALALARVKSLLYWSERK